MKSFLAKNWLLIGIPVVVIAILVALILTLGGSDPDDGFQYGL